MRRRLKINLSTNMRNIKDTNQLKATNCFLLGMFQRFHFRFEHITTW